MDIQEVRELFPYIRTGRIYLNHASTGPLSSKVIDKINAALKNSSEGNIDDYFSFLRVVDETKKQMADYLNTEPSRISFGDNTTNGMNLLAQGIEWKKGDRVILNDIEFPANVYPFLNLQSYGVEVDFIKSKDGIVSADDIINNVKPGTRLISVSQVQFLSGYRIDLEKLGLFCCENEIILSVDAIQGLGAYSIDVKKENVDFISSGTQKWLLGLQGLSIIYVSQKLQDILRPKYAGWLSVEGAWDLLNYDLTLKSTADRFQTGTLNTLGIHALNASMHLFYEYGITKIKQQVTKNASLLMNGLCEAGFNPLLQKCEEKNLSGIVSFRVEDSKSFFEKLSALKINSALREGIIRLSPHFYNNEEDIEKVITAIKTMGKH